MKKYSIMIHVIFIVALLYFCEACKRKGTPKNYINHTIVKRQAYIKDSIEIIQQLKSLLVKQKDFFENPDYFNSTKLIIDTIIYAPDLNKLAVFLITKNPENRHLVPNKNYDWYYDATCYLGVKQKGKINLFWIGPSFTNSNDKEELSRTIRDSYFTNFATKDTTGLHTYKYNMNDLRFWDSAIWKEIEFKKIEEQEFELEKRKHPENIYEPKTDINTIRER